jgi:hypothetical protein
MDERFTPIERRQTKLMDRISDQEDVSRRMQVQLDRLSAVAGETEKWQISIKASIRAITVMMAASPAVFGGLFWLFNHLK